ncbi:MAG: signal recognition particle-docking protein FtsY [Bacilli bacterium]|jgi:fused signal recognition particle receptor|nr:signal recognition particle-docking protein FtsY [Bacilli bacterium]MDD3422293.1 signal recognition particle-docking protein FtsY [Bacilli bacterium]MDD4065744.1 signal recognition particle-docking protein FtsY [Bacilli bacterium]
MGFFSKLKQSVFGKKKTDAKTEQYQVGLSQSRRSFKDKLSRLFAKHREVDEAFFSELNDLLIESDVGASLAAAIIEETKIESQVQHTQDPQKIYEIMVEKMRDFYLQDLEVPTSLNYAEDGPTVILVVGVNGVGKTTAIAKLAFKLKNEGRSILLVAGDTFRAGAVEQLDVWASRIGVKVVQGPENSDPSSVIYEGLAQAKKDKIDVVICDTAGRLQTKANLMAELNKIHRVMQKIIPAAPHEAFLVLDATMGQNGIIQAEAFAQVTTLTGIILTKMDSTSKGGIVLAIKHQLGIPVRYIGLGEKMQDLAAFDLDAYLWGLIGGEEHAS